MSRPKVCAKPNVRTATANRYELIIDHCTIPRIGSIKLEKLTTRYLQKLYKELLEGRRIHIGKNQDKGLSTTTVRSVHLMLHCALERAVKEQLMQRNPSENCIVPKPRKLDMNILPPGHIRAYLEAARARGPLPMFYLELASGLLVALRWDDVDVKTVSFMLGHFDAGFTLRTYTHATRQKQDEAAQTKGNFMEQVL